MNLLMMVHNPRPKDYKKGVGRKMLPLTTRIVVQSVENFDKDEEHCGNVDED